MTPEQQRAVALANARMRMAQQQSPAPVQTNKTPETSFLKGFGLGAADMTSFGLDDELRGFGRAIGSKIRGDERSFSELARLGIEELKSQHETAQTEKPGAYLSGQVAGAVAPAFISPGAALTSWLSKGKLAARAGKSALVGGLSSAAYGFGSGEDGLENRISSAAEYGIPGAVIGAALPVVGAGLKALNRKTVVPTSEQVRSAGSDLFQKAEAEGGVINPEIADKFRDKVLSTLDLDSEAKLFSSNPVAERLVNNIGEFKGKPLSFNTAKQIDEKLGDLAYSTMDNFGKLDSEGAKFLKLQSELREAMDNIPGGETISEARKLWSTSLKMRDIERIIQKSEGKDQPVTILKNGFARLRDTGMKGYSSAEKAAIKRAAKTGLVPGFFKLMGSGLVPIGSAITGTATGGPLGGAAAGAAGYALQQGSKAIGVGMQTAKAKNALKAVAQGSGLVLKEPLLQIPSSVSSIIQPQQSSALVEFSKKFDRKIVNK